MGYDMQLCIFKKKTLDYIKQELKSEQYEFSEIYSEVLFCWLYPNDYKIPTDEIGKYICYEITNIFEEFFKPKIENGQAIIIDESTYNKMLKWLENKLKAKNKIDMYPYIRVYKNMKNTNIDFKTEFVVFEHDW